jgi:FtsH-binding integral membrane protein
MKRFLIFALLFPGIALAVFFALLSMAMGMFPDNPQALFVVGWGYVVGVVPALVCAVVDLLLRKTYIPAVIGTTLVGYGIAILAGLTIFDWGLIGKILAFGLIGAIPAAVCSWLSNEKQNMGADA